MRRERCDIYRVAEQCGVRLFDGRHHSPSSRRRRECFCKPTLRAIGRRFGEAHLALALRLIVETGNSTELYAETIKAVSTVLRSGLVSHGGALFEAFDAIDLGELRAWAHAARGRSSTAEAMATVMLWILANPSRLRA